MRHSEFTGTEPANDNPIAPKTCGDLFEQIAREQPIILGVDMAGGPELHVEAIFDGEELVDFRIVEIRSDACAGCRESLA